MPTIPTRKYNVRGNEFWICVQIPRITVHEIQIKRPSANRFSVQNQAILRKTVIEGLRASFTTRIWIALAQVELVLVKWESQTLQSSAIWVVWRPAIDRVLKRFENPDSLPINLIRQLLVTNDTRVNMTCHENEIISAQKFQLFRRWGERRRDRYASQRKDEFQRSGGVGAIQRLDPKSLQNEIQQFAVLRTRSKFLSSITGESSLALLWYLSKTGLRKPKKCIEACILISKKQRTS